MGIVIAISGLHGTGKSTYARQIAHDFGLEYVSAGGLFRQTAEERGLSVEVLSSICDEELDRRIDERTRLWAEKGTVVLDGLLAGWMSREYPALKIHLIVPEEIRVKRIADRDNVGLEEARRSTSQREKSEKRRFKTRYRIDLDDLSIYDLVINTSLMPIESNMHVLTEFVKEYMKAMYR